MTRRIPDGTAGRRTGLLSLFARAKRFFTSPASPWTIAAIDAEPR